MRTLLCVLTFATLNLAGVARAQLVEVGNGLIYHPAADLTWTADTNPFGTLLQTNPNLVDDIIAAWTRQLPFGQQIVRSRDFDTVNARLSWYGAYVFIEYLNRTNYKGYNDWRMPDMGPTRHPGSCNSSPSQSCTPLDGVPISSSEWFQLFYNELGGIAHVSLYTTHNANFDLFDFRGSSWFSGGRSGDLVNTGDVAGGQNRNFLGSVQSQAWPVRDGASVANPPPMSRLLYPVDALTFANQVAHTTGAPQTFSIMNTGTKATGNLLIAAADNFPSTHDCPVSLAIGATCTVSVSFRPDGVGNQSGTLTLSADGRSYEIALTGKGLLGLDLAPAVATATAGVPVALTWSATSPASTCTANGGATGDGWTGAIASSGSRSVTASSAGDVSYGIRCSISLNGELFEATDSVSVTYTLPSVAISADSTNIQQGQPNTLTWTATNAEACTASSNGAAGQWSGARATSGAAPVSESVLGMITYTITCTAGPQSAKASVAVFVNAPTGSANSGGGGTLGWLTLLALAWLLVTTCHGRGRRGTQWA